MQLWSQFIFRLNDVVIMAFLKTTLYLSWQLVGEMFYPETQPKFVTKETRPVSDTVAYMARKAYRLN